MIPHDDLAFQWDVCQDVLDWKDYFPNRPESYKEDITGMLARLGNAVPEPGPGLPRPGSSHPVSRASWRSPSSGPLICG